MFEKYKMQIPKTLQNELMLNEDIIKPKDIFQDRERTNILRSAERVAVYFLVKRIPAFVTPNMLTGVGMVGSLLVLAAFILASYINTNYLLLGIVGIAAMQRTHHKYMARCRWKRPREDTC